MGEYQKEACWRVLEKVMGESKTKPWQSPRKIWRVQEETGESEKKLWESIGNDKSNFRRKEGI